MVNYATDYESPPEPTFVQQHKLQFKPPNNGHYITQNNITSGSFYPMGIYSDSQKFLYLKHGSNNLLSYNGGINPNVHGFSTRDQKTVQQCSLRTLDPYGCQKAQLALIREKMH